MVNDIRFDNEVNNVNLTSAVTLSYGSDVIRILFEWVYHLGKMIVTKLGRIANLPFNSRANIDILENRASWSLYNSTCIGAPVVKEWVWCPTGFSLAVVRFSPTGLGSGGEDDARAPTLSHSCRSYRSRIRQQMKYTSIFVGCLQEAGGSIRLELHPRPLSEENRLHSNQNATAAIYPRGHQI